MTNTAYTASQVTDAERGEELLATKLILLGQLILSIREEASSRLKVFNVI